MAVSTESNDLAARLLNHPNTAVPLGVIEVLAANPEAARTILTPDWISAAAADANSGRRQLAASALGARRDQASPLLLRLLGDNDPAVTAAACEAAAIVQDRSYVQPLVSRLGESRVRGAIISALARFGPRIAGTLGDFLEDSSASMAIRRQIPRVLQRVTDQRAVDVLLRSIGIENLNLRHSVIRSLNKLREDSPDLNYGPESVRRQILDEARYYYKMHAALAPFQDQRDPATPAGLLARTMEARLKETIERLFRLLGLRYPQKEIYAAWLAVHRGSSSDHSAAVEFLDSVLDREMKRVLMPLLDTAEHQTLAGRDLFGVEARTAVEAVRELMDSGDVWLVACAIATAAQLSLRSLGSRIRQLSEDSAGAEVVLVAKAALPAVS
jgi:HEAT repeat protein